MPRRSEPAELAAVFDGVVPDEVAEGFEVSVEAGEDGASKGNDELQPMAERHDSELDL